jgi:hypothetical protein
MDPSEPVLRRTLVRPDVTTPAGGNQICLSRVIFLNNRQTGQLVRQQIVVMYINATTRDVNTITPRDRQC